MRLFGSRMHVWGEGVEWWTETRRCIFPFLLSAALCSPAVMAARLAFAITQKYQPLLFSWLLVWLRIFPCSYFFLQGWRSYLRMCKDEWTYLLEQKCPNTIINQQLLILGKQSSPPPGFICLASMASLHQRNGVVVFQFSISHISEYYKISQARNANFADRNIFVLFPVACEHSV